MLKKLLFLNKGDFMPKINRLALLALSYVPRQLPVGMQEFSAWSDRIISLSGQFADADSMRFALASQIMHLAPQKSKVPDQYFIRSMRKAAANQVASQVFQDIKTKQIEAQKQAEATASQQEATEPVASSGQQ